MKTVPHDSKRAFHKPIFLVEYLNLPLEEEVRFDYQRPTDITDALELLDIRAQPRRAIAYGSDFLVWSKGEVIAEPDSVVDLTGVRELNIIEERESHLFIGSCNSLATLGRAKVVRERFPALAKAIGTMGSVQLREGASLGGNICTASPAGDSGPPLLCYHAKMKLISSGGEREIPADEFYLGPGKTALEPGELLAGVCLPWTVPGSFGVYLKGARRAAVDLALVSVAAVASPSPQNPSGVELRMALGAVAPTPIRAKAAEQLAKQRGLDKNPTSELGIAIAEAAREAACPIDDIRSSASYRKRLVGELASRAAGQLATALSLGNTEINGEK